jgi:excisionase family DNA binding protein
MSTIENVSRRERAASSLRDRLSRPAPAVWLSGQEAAEYVGVSWPTLRQVLIHHAIPHVAGRLGKLWRVEVAVLDDAPAAPGPRVRDQHQQPDL